MFLMGEVPLYHVETHQIARNVIEIQYTYRGTSIIRNCTPLGPYSRSLRKALWCS